MRFYRVHWADSPTFAAENAWSALWGATRTADGTQTICVACDGTGSGSRPCPTCNGAGFDATSYDHQDCETCEGTGDVAGCISCEGEGAQDCQRGYSCFTDPQSLKDYFISGGRSGVVGDDDKVIIFEGDYQGTGFDGEDLAVPTQIIEEMTWTEFLSRNS